MKTLRNLLCSAAVASVMASGAMADGHGWSLKDAAAPYAGTTVDVVFLLRPGYEAIEAMLPAFEEETGIKVNVIKHPYENALGEQVRDFVAGGDLDVALIDLVWIGSFAENEWILPLADVQAKFPDAVDPDLDIDDFFPLVLNAFGGWNDTIYGLPFDNYSGLMFYNRCMLEEAGFDGPPSTWEELKDVYGPALTKDGKYAFALQSKRNETQSADSFARMLWPFGGSFLNEEFRSNLMSEGSQAGLKFRQELMEYMPDGIVAYDHAETVNAFSQGDVAMITEWSAFYSSVVSPETSRVADCVEIAPEPMGPAGRKPALGGFSLAVASQADEAEQAAAYLFIQWATSKANAREYLERGGVPARQSVYQQDGLEEFKFVPALVESWQDGVPEFRPRFAEWPEITEIVQEWGTKMMLGEVTTEEGAQEIGTRMEEVLDAAGYYSGEKPLAQ
ncbi:ABC-type sugar / sn-glycerol 3-phosphate transport protein [Dinoroseobacter shibae DFL 12 = DSM 16493]|uniref:ABC-type sugar / sn-glycerol 3-phosphate transport protein n=2 Tax=Dinoroseobacter shibae TaxID=215813 RepID=A8LPH0_DINSH|nr:sugar ABC transporter substrate-binding protein [Dinoroseobacter shibae]ABV92293.1 ABC-type sugar / sn-glycerol 3-phosphate transport protein [Dinoroseobacter shibae DFL 12 = DSM 16493]URF47245.1 sugar ABC transporter substrate-binding protein [Dinoroseobacter shibae]URF51556.1 sugar ABC transporter substrate-binding protein [Dinoroseobacter shibae]